MQVNDAVQRLGLHVYQPPQAGSQQLAETGRPGRGRISFTGLMKNPSAISLEEQLDLLPAGPEFEDHGPGRDLVREFVDACREFDLKIGFYYSLMDWHHPDGARCATDEAARRRFLDYLQGCARELCTNYGKIDIFWHDVSWPLPTPEAWESVKMNAMIRELQPHILINNRSKLDEDFGTPEEHVTTAGEGRDWEACMTFNGSWGYMPISPDWRSVREVIGMLQTAAAGQGNLLRMVKYFERDTHET